MRKLKAVLALATQSLADLQKEDTQVISDQIGNSIYLPQPEATRPETRRLYEAAGLTAEQIQLLATATPKGEYLLQTEELTRLVSFRLDGDALRLCGASSPADIARARAMLAEGVRPGEEFCRAWLDRTTEEWLRRAGRRVPARGGVDADDVAPASSARSSPATAGAAASAAGRAATATCGGIASPACRRAAGELLGDVRRLQVAMVGKAPGARPVRRARPRPRPRVATAAGLGRGGADRRGRRRLRRVRLFLVWAVERVPVTQWGLVADALIFFGMVLLLAVVVRGLLDRWRGARAARAVERALGQGGDTLRMRRTLLAAAAAAGILAFSPPPGRADTFGGLFGSLKGSGGII